MPRLPLLAAVAFLAAGTAEAHAPGAGGFGFAAGVSHPFLGADHLMAMVAVGLLAAQQPGKVWLLPGAFVAAMAAGLGLGALGVGGVPLEGAIIGSVVLLGALVAWGRSLAPAALVAVVAVSAALHGHAHGVELPAASSAMGALAGTAVLHAVGVALGLGLKAAAVRTCGAAFAAVAVVLVLA